jgi:hypothetical protein
MSHTVSLKLKVKDKRLLKEIALKKGYKVEDDAHVRFFSSEEYGMAVYLPGWHYPVVVTDGGEVRYDNYNGKWGKQEVLNELMQDYATELVLRTARMEGYLILEQSENENERVIRLGRA